MTRHYSPKTFLRQVPNALLAEFFSKRNLLADVLFYLQKEREIDRIYNAWQALPDRDRIAVEKSFREIDGMAREQGIKALIEEARFHNVDLAAELSERDGFHHKAMWTFLRHDRVFYVASIINYADTLLHGRYWVRRSDMPRKAPKVAQQDLSALANALSDYYKREEGRGHRCTVETYLRTDRYHYFFAYPDDYTDTYIGHAEDGRLVRRPQKGAFEVVFVYDPEDGTLDLFAKGGKNLRATLQQIFGLLILGERIAPEQPRTGAYQLDGLLSRDFSFPTEIEDRIAKVRVLELRLSSVGNGNRRITLEADPGGPIDDIYNLIDQHLSKDVPLSLTFHVTRAVFQFEFAPIGDVYQKPLKFSVSYPSSSNLKSQSEEHRLLGEKYLKRWNIDCG